MAIILVKQICTIRRASTCLSFATSRTIAAHANGDGQKRKGTIIIRFVTVYLYIMTSSYFLRN